jgi:hypothetical protein
LTRERKIARVKAAMHRDSGQRVRVELLFPLPPTGCGAASRALNTAEKTAVDAAVSKDPSAGR